MDFFLLRRVFFFSGIEVSEADDEQVMGSVSLIDIVLPPQLTLQASCLITSKHLTSAGGLVDCFLFCRDLGAAAELASTSMIKLTTTEGKSFNVCPFIHKSQPSPVIIEHRHRI